MENQLQLALTSPTTSFMSLFDSQKEIFRSQIDQFRNIVLQQRNLTGVNPLSQEMAAGALSIKIGKRPRDLLNPKAIKYMQSIFSLKDTINKKETHEISALFGVTVTQVRDFFTAQRTRVRKFLRLSREKPSISNLSIEGPCPIPLSSDPSSQTEPVPLDSAVPICTEEGPSCSTQDEVLSIIEERDRHFIDDIFTSMTKVEAFSEKVKLMDGILEVQNPSVLNWFLDKGGVMILSAWLTEAAGEEQTSVLHIILKVLCHLPLHKAIPEHMSAILQSVNSLRFYRTPDISKRARIFLARWSKMSQAMKKRDGIKSASDVHDELLLQQSISEVVGDEIWNSKIEDVEEAHANLCGTSENSRKLDSPQPVKLLTASSDDSNQRLKGALVSKTRERRKTQLMEQPSQRTTGRSLGRPAPATQGRPLSADDIQKAKMRAQFMQRKYGKTNNDDSSRMKPQAPNGISSPPDGILHGARKLQDRPKVDDCEKLNSVASKGSNHLENHLKLSFDVEKPPSKRCKRMQIPWRKPPEVQLSSTWKVCAGNTSKEVNIQNNRIRRERETIYRTVQEIPLNPKEPWDPEMEPDDTLTTEIPIEQLPNAEGAETGVLPLEDRESEAAALASMPNDIATTAAPDVELLAILLKNPELVYDLTSGQGRNLYSEQTVMLLDKIKADGMNSLSIQTNLRGDAEKKVEVSLPPPTPSSDPGTSGSLAHQQMPLVPQMAHQLALLQAAAGSALNSIHMSGTIQRSSPMPIANVQQRHSPQMTPPRPQLQTQLQPGYAPEPIWGTVPGSALNSIPIANVQQSHSPQMTPPRPQLQTQLQPGYAPEPMWGTIPGSALNSIPNHYNAHVTGHVEPGLQQAAWRGGNNNYVEEAGFESWSPDNSPVRRQEQVGRWNYAQPQMNMRDNYRPDLSTSRNPGYYPGYRGPDDGGNRRDNYRPDLSTSRNPGYYSGYRGPDDGENRRWNYPQPQMNMRDNYRPDCSTTRNPGYGGPDDGGNRRWNYPQPQMNMRDNYRPDYSTTRNPGYRGPDDGGNRRRNYPQPQMNMRDNYRPDCSTSRNPGNYSGYHGPDDGGNRRRGDRRR